MKSKKILLAILIITLVNCHKFKQSLFKCEHNNEEDKNLLPNRVIEVSDQEKEKHKRRIESETDADGFKNFSIYVDLENIKNDIKNLGLEDNEDFFISSIQNAVKALTSLLKVKPLIGNYYLNDEDFKKLGIDKWETEKFGTAAKNKNIYFQNLNIDLVIFGMFSELGESTLATASAKAVQETSEQYGQPYVGLLKINKNVDYSLENSKKYFETILVHEFTHILGFSKHFFEDYYHNIYSKKDEFGITRSYLNSTKLLNVARNYFNCPTLEGVELENQGGEGTEGSHWEARILLGEYMNGYSYTEEQVISEFTLAVLEDSGYYKANYYTGGLMRFGKHKGCEFLKERCINKETQRTNENFTNEFYDPLSISENGIEAGCSSGRQSRTYKVFYGLENDIEKEYIYFKDNITGYPPADYCPINQKNQEEEDHSYYSGHCSSKGKGYYGGEDLLGYIPFLVPDASSKALAPKTGEVLSESSFCFLSSLAKSSLHDAQYISMVVRANCHEIFCSEKSLTIKIFDDYIVCPRAGGKIKVDGYLGDLYCPDYNLMCSGSKICNDIFDCIEKKSEIKDMEYKYDYDIRTSQVITNDKNYATDNYELSDDGKCIKNCKHCTEDKKCTVCGDNYILHLDDNGNLKCSSKEYFEVGYYVNQTTGLYEKCMENCDICHDKETCGGCKDRYLYVKDENSNSYHCAEAGPDQQLIPHCLFYDKSLKCSKCNDNYGFNGTDRSTCLSIETNLSHYYTKDHGYSYFPCSEENSNCTGCYYEEKEENNIGVHCYQCTGNMILLNKQRGLCVEKQDLENKTRYYFINETHAGDCSVTFENCISCDNDIFCSKCKYGYGYSGEYGKCVPKEMIKKVVIASDGTTTYEEVKKNEPKGRKKRKVNSSSYFSIINILKLQVLYLLFLVIKV